MTPEERFTKIENAIEALRERQVQRDTEIEKQNADIRDLVIWSQRLLDAQE